MGAIKQNKIKRLSGATLIESMVAMVLVLLCFVIASMVFVRVNNSAALQHDYLAKELVSTWHQEVFRLEQTERSFEDWHVKRTVEAYGLPEIWQIHYQVWNPSGNLQYEEKRIKYLKKVPHELPE